MKFMASKTMRMNYSTLDTAFQMSASNLRFGRNVTREVGMDCSERGFQKALIVTDENLVNVPSFQTLLESLKRDNVDYTVFVHEGIEPTDRSMMKAIDFGNKNPHDVVISYGGGSVMDTAKMINLFTNVPYDDIFDFVNAPIGRAKPVPDNAVKYHIAIPTTTGTGSETTGVIIFDVEKDNFKTGIAHRNLKPDLAIVDPLNAKSMSKEMIASSGFDVFSHAIESYTALPYNQRPLPTAPKYRPAYQGSNPLSDIWSSSAIQICSKYLRKAFEHDEEALEQLALAASSAGLGFGTAGVHLPHGISYPVSGGAHQLDYFPSGYNSSPNTKPFVPHGQSVILNCPGVFEFISPSCPLKVRNLLDIFNVPHSSLNDDQLGEALSGYITEYMRDLEVPNGLSALGYKDRDIEALVKGTLPQKRVTNLSPRPFTEKDLSEIVQRNMKLW